MHFFKKKKSNQIMYIKSVLKLLLMLHKKSGFILLQDYFITIIVKHAEMP